MIIREILDRKGRDVVTVEVDRTVLQAMRLLAEHRIGALVVLREGDVVGILSERDVLNLGAEDPDHLRTRTVAQTMTEDPIVGVPDDRIDYVMEIMTRNRIRHLPIVKDGELAGIVSIGDVVNTLRRGVEAENRHLTRYVQGLVQ